MKNTIKTEGSPLKCKCGSTTLHVITQEQCSRCKYNGEFSERLDRYVYPRKDNAWTERTQVQDESECKLGECYDNDGCYIIECAKCHKIVCNIVVPN